MGRIIKKCCCIDGRKPICLLHKEREGEIEYGMGTYFIIMEMAEMINLPSHHQAADVFALEVYQQC